MLVAFATREDCVYEYPLRIDSKQNSQASDANFSLGAPINKMVRSTNWVIGSLK